jgi:urease accessory protein
MSALVGGALHPLLAPAHLLALIGLGLLIGQRRNALRWAPLLAFALGLLCGLVALRYGVGETSAGQVALAAAVVTGLCAAFVLRVPMLLCAAIALVVGVAIGLDSPPHVVSLAAANLMLVGTGLGACVVLALVVAAAAFATRQWQRIALRVLASWSAASALLVLALRLVR